MEFAIQVGGGQIRHEKSGIEAIVEETQLAESVGFDVVFVPDHYVFESLGVLRRDVAAYETFFTLATLAQRTKTIKLGTQVACMLFRHPAMTARLFAQVDEASGGRVIAGVGAGWTRAEFEMMDLPFPPITERLAMMDEAVTVMRGLWSNESFNHEGKYYRIKEGVCLPHPVQKPGPPIMLGGSGNGILRRAGTWADIIHMIPPTGAAGTTTLDAVREFDDAAITAKLARVREHERAASRPAGSVRFGTTIYNCTVTETVAEAREIAERMCMLFGLSAEQFVRHPVSLVGTPPEIVEELHRRIELHGISLLAVNFTSPSQVRLFGEQVIAKM